MDRESLILEIENAFAEVSLEEGIGIIEAEAIDDYSNDKFREKARAGDYRDSWEIIPDEIIENAYSALCFVDEKGIKFCLPAYMRFALRYYDTNHSTSGLSYSRILVGFLLDFEIK